MSYQAAVAAVQALHHKSLFPIVGGPNKGLHRCPGCSTSVDHHILDVLWPCPTAKAVQKALGSITAAIQEVPETPSPDAVTVRAETARLGLEVMQARARGDQARGGPAVEDQLTGAEWLADIQGQVTAARAVALKALGGLVVGDGQVVVPGRHLANYRAHLVAVAVLSLAAVESFDRLTR